jgi:hypothetical protein
MRMLQPGIGRAARPNAARGHRRFPAPALLLPLALVAAVALAGQVRLASAATQTSQMTSTGFTCSGTICPAVILSVGDTIEYQNATTVTLKLVIVNVTQQAVSVPPGGKWSYPATTPLSDAQVVAQNDPSTPLPPVDITQLITVTPVSTSTTTSTTSTPTPTPTPSPQSSSSTTRSSSSSTPAATGMSQPPVPVPAGVSAVPPGGSGGSSDGGGSSAPVVPAGPGSGRSQLASAGGVNAAASGSGSSAARWFLIPLLVAIAVGAAFLNRVRRSRKTLCASPAASVPSDFHSCRIVETPSDEQGPPVTYIRT